MKLAGEAAGVTGGARRDREVHIDAGELMTVTGPSGSGKSALLHLVGGMKSGSWKRGGPSDPVAPGT
ncbi:MAG: hypothetical protein ACRDX8_12505 [Acidimicrobiales bacterium]